MDFFLVQQPLLFCVGEEFIPPVEWMAAAHFPGAVKTAPYKAPVNGDPRKKQQKNTFNILQMFGL